MSNLLRDVTIDVLVVLYNPEKKLLNDLIKSLLCGADNLNVRFVFYLNSKISFSLNTLSFRNSTYACLGQNTNDGIAKAHIELLNFSKFSNYSLISDQDTIYPTGFINNMILFSKEFNSSFSVPAWFDINSKRFAKQYVRYPYALILEECTKGDELSHAISSGTFINNFLFKYEILPDEKLFIDWVDNDWFWLLNEYGYKILYNKDVVLHHQLGTDSSDLIFFKYTRRPPVRDYYIVTNSFKLFFKHKKLNIKLFLARSFFKHLILSLITSDSINSFFTRINLFIKGIRND